MSMIGLIPARGDSKGIKNKNIVELNGKPLIAYTIKAALDAERIDRVIVSTDSKEVAKIARDCGAEVPFLRPGELARDDTPDLPVMRYAIDWLSDQEGYTCDYLVYLRPTTPFKTGALIDAAADKIVSEETCSGLRTVTPAEGVHHPYWMYRKSDEHLVSFIDGLDRDRYYQRQLLPLCFRVNGVVDIVRAANIKRDILYGDRIAYYELTQEQSLDIDTEYDLKVAEFLMRESRKGGSKKG